MTELWLVRHGQTDWNLEGRYQGRSDVPLNTIGLDQVRDLANRLRGKRFVAIYSSNLKRARQTAEVLEAKLGLPMIVDQRLKEACLGDWEGKLFKDISEDYVDEMEERRKNPVHARPPGGETVAEVASRVAQVADDIVRSYPVGPVIVVSHGLALATLICQAKRLPLSMAYSIIPNNVKPAVIEWTDKHSKFVDSEDSINDLQ